MRKPLFQNYLEEKYPNEKTTISSRAKLKKINEQG